MPIQGSDLNKELLVEFNRTVFDLSGSAQTEVILYNKNYEIQINKIWIKYIEASSADAGVLLKVGTHANDDEFFSATSQASKDAYYSKEYDTGDMILNIVPKDTPVVVYSAGGKSGAGTVHIAIAYSLIQ